MHLRRLVYLNSNECEFAYFNLYFVGSSVNKMRGQYTRSIRYTISPKDKFEQNSTCQLSVSHEMTRW